MAAPECSAEDRAEKHVPSRFNTLRERSRSCGNNLLGRGELLRQDQRPWPFMAQNAQPPPVLILCKRALNDSGFSDGSKKALNVHRQPFSNLRLERHAAVPFQTQNFICELAGRLRDSKPELRILLTFFNCCQGCSLGGGAESMSRPEIVSRCLSVLTTLNIVNYYHVQDGSSTGGGCCPDDRRGPEGGLTIEYKISTISMFFENETD